MKKILILEDEEIFGKSYKKAYENAGYEVIWVKTCNKALNAIKDFEPDIIHTDCDIKGENINGMDILPAFREKNINSYIFMVSNNNDWQFKEKAIKNGANNYFLKIDHLPNKLIKIFKGLKKGEAYKDWRNKYDKLPSIKEIDNKILKKTMLWLKQVSVLAKMKGLA